MLCDKKSSELIRFDRFCRSKGELVIYRFGGSELGKIMGRTRTLSIALSLFLTITPMPFLSGASKALGLSNRVLLAKTVVASSYGKLPLSFEPNSGQTDGRVKFLSHGPGYTLFLTPTEA